MEKWTLKSIVEKARKIVDEKKINMDGKISVDISLKEDSKVSFSIRYGPDSRPFDDKITEDSVIYGHGDNVDELLLNFSHHLDLQKVTRQTTTDFPY